MRFRSLILLATTLGVITACEKAPTVDRAAEEKAIRDLGTQWNQDLANRNDSAIAAYYAADAVLLPPNEAAITGTAAIRQYWAGLWPLNAALTITQDRITLSQAGDMAIDQGTWAITATAPTGPFSDNGKYVVVWTRTNEGWKVSQDIWNSNNPLPGITPDSVAAK